MHAEFYNKYVSTVYWNINAIINNLDINAIINNLNYFLNSKKYLCIWKQSK